MTKGFMKGEQMTRALGLVILGLAGCTSRPGTSNQATPFPQMLSAGVLVDAKVDDSLSSRHNKAGETLTATVSYDVRDAGGRVVIPAGSSVGLKIAELEPATNKSQEDGKIALDVTSVTIRGQSYSVGTRVISVPHRLEGRGVTVGEVEKVGVGAVAGAVAGQVIGGSVTSTVVGGAVGAAAGSAVAVHYASRDVVVARWAAIQFSLPQDLNIMAAR